MAVNPAIINVGPFDAQLTLNTALPASGQTVYTGILDLGTKGGNSNAWRQGRFAVYFPALPENTVAGGIVITMLNAGPSLTNSLPAPAPAVPGAFGAPPGGSQVITLAGVAGTGTPATVYYMTLEWDNTGSTYQFYQFTILTTAGINTLGENIRISWIKDSE